MSAEARPGAGRRLVEAVYYAFVFSIPLESIIYIQKEDGREGGVSISRILGILLFGVSLVNRRLCYGRLPAAFWLFAWYLAVYTVSQLWIPAQLDARFHEQQFAMLQMAALFLISLNLFADEDFRRRVLRVYGWGIGLTALAMALGLVGGQFGVEDRRTVFEQNPNMTAALFGFGALCIGSDPRLREGPWRAPRAVLSLAAVAVLVAGILRTGSRGGLLGLGGGILGLALCGGRSTRVMRFVVAAFSLGLLSLLIRREFQNETDTAARLERSWTEGDTSGRTGIYNAAWTMFMERPLLGYGGAYNRFILGTELNRAGRGDREADRDTHNVFLAVLTEVGLIGGLPFIAGMLLAVATAWRSARRTGDALPFALMCTLIIINFSGTGYRQKMFWIVLAAAVATGLRRARPA